MVRWHRFWTAPLFALTFLVGGVAAQEPKTGKFYPVPSLGFEVKVPIDWETIPPDPNEKNLIVKFDPKNLKYVWVGKGDQLFTHCWLLKFDRRKKAGEEGEGDDKDKKVKLNFGNGAKDITAWAKSGSGVSFAPEGTPKDIEVNKVPAKIHIFSNTKTWEEPVKMFACVYQLEPEVDVAIVFNGPGDSRKWTKWENVFEEMAKSLRRTKAKESDKPVAVVDPANMTLRDKKRAEWVERLRDTPAWKLYETPNYFLVSSNPDKAFLDELMARLEAIRSIYEQDYPADKIAELKKLAAETATKDPGAKKDDVENEIMKALNEGGDPREMSRCSIVRVCKDAEQYHSYGGPGGSAGYWSPMDKELVLYDDRKVGGKGDTWAVLNHEAFHQYIFYFYGNISPHSWYNEGTGDFYAGYDYKNKRFKLEKFQWRVGTIKAAIQSKKHVELKEFVRWTQAEYYGQNKLGVDGGQNYAQGWSLVYFLRTGKKNNAKGWDPKWDGILESYLRELAMTNSTDKAVEKAFEGVDIAVLEQAWIEYTK